MQKLVKTGKYTEINKQSNVKFWLNGKKYGIISYSLSCTFLSMEESIFYILKTPKYCQIYKSLQLLPVCGTTKVRTCYYCFCERKGHLSSHGKKSSEPISTLFVYYQRIQVFLTYLCFDNRKDCYSHRHSTNSALFFSQLLAHCFNVDFQLHPKLIAKLRTIQVILETWQIKVLLM